MYLTCRFGIVCVETEPAHNGELVSVEGENNAERACPTCPAHYFHNDCSLWLILPSAAHPENHSCWSLQNWLDVNIQSSQLKLQAISCAIWSLHAIHIILCCSCEEHTGPTIWFTLSKSSCRYINHISSACLKLLTKLLTEEESSCSQFILFPKYKQIWLSARTLDLNI